MYVKSVGKNVFFFFSIFNLTAYSNNIIYTTSTTYNTNITNCTYNTYNTTVTYTTTAIYKTILTKYYPQYRTLFCPVYLAIIIFKINRKKVKKTCYILISV